MKHKEQETEEMEEKKAMPIWFIDDVHRPNEPRFGEWQTKNVKIKAYQRDVQFISSLFIEMSLTANDCVTVIQRI